MSEIEGECECEDEQDNFHLDANEATSLISPSIDHLEDVQPEDIPISPRSFNNLSVVNSREIYHSQSMAILEQEAHEVAFESARTRAKLALNSSFHDNSPGVRNGNLNEHKLSVFGMSLPLHDQFGHLYEQQGQVAFQRVIITDGQKEHDSAAGAVQSKETAKVCKQIVNACDLRVKYVEVPRKPIWGGIHPEKHKKKYAEITAQDKKLSYRRPNPPFIPLPSNFRNDQPINLSDPFFDKSDLRPEADDLGIGGENLYNEAENLEKELKVSWVDGVALVFPKGVKALDPSSAMSKPPSVREYYRDLNAVLTIVHDAACKSFTFKRMQILESLFNLHKLLNADKESLEQRKVPHRDFYNIRKVDTHIHHSAIMNQKHLLRFIKHKMKYFGDELVCEREGGLLTLTQVFERLQLTSYDLSIDTLDMHADTNTFHRFDRFNLKYNPIGESSLREIFLKTDNYIGGRYLADITKEVYHDLEKNKYVYLEPRVSVYGKSLTEWMKLAHWWRRFGLDSEHVRYMIQIPRLYSVYRSVNLVNSFQDLLSNIFDPLFEVSVNPAANMELHFFLRHVTGFDCVDDESKLFVDGRNLDVAGIPPEKWTYDFDPPYSYWMYYLHANLKTLNDLRKSQGMGGFELRPHAGEAGDMDNLASTFLLADRINHGILLRKSPALQYMYYLCQVGLAMSPLSNNKLFLDYHSNPFPLFFARGLNVSLSTDDPLMLHITREPLVEEYSVAAQVWKFSSTDLSEIARNSVLQSGFEHPFKQHFLGAEYFGEEKDLNTKEELMNKYFRVFKNNIGMTNLPDIRLTYRKERLEAEWELLLSGGM